jgi:hypothetical protein
LLGATGMTFKKNILLILFNLSFVICFSQEESNWSLSIAYDTIPNKDSLANSKFLKNNGDTIFLVADFNFNGDIVSVYGKNKVFSKKFVTDDGLGLAGEMYLPRIKEMELQINSSLKFKINFDSNYSYVHLYLRNKQIIWTYTNRLHLYE